MLSRPLSLWPELLLGPMLRRVEEHVVCVFVALRHAADVELRLYAKRRISPGDQPLASGMRRTVPLGQNLHVALVSAQPGAALVSNRVYAYDVAIKPVGAPPTDPGKTLADLGMLSDPYMLGYEPDALPTFALPPGLEHLHVVHGSCRKTNGYGPDMLASLDDLIQASFQQPLERPHQLFLTGDQIYADDVAVSLTRALTELTRELIGGAQALHEQMAAPGGSGPWTCLSPELEAGPARGEFIKAHTGFQTTARDGHLIFLGEYYAMYLLTWSDALWPRRIDPAPPGSPWDPDLPALGDFNTSQWDLKRTSDFSAERERTLQLAREVRRVRRALANVPTYMLLDDHEVTDDWYLNSEIQQAMLQSPQGKRIIRNALIAYAIFQDWGNQPDRYEPGTVQGLPTTAPPGARLLDRIRSDAKPSPPQTLPPVLDEKEDAIIEVLLDLNPSVRQPREGRVCWDWAVQWDEHQLLALDTRTWRQFPPEKMGAARLISEPAMQWQLDDRLEQRAWRPTPELDSQKLTFLISPAPVLGLPLIETGQALSAFRNVYQNDNEPWVGDRECFDSLITRLARGLGRVIILSGDVHYAFTHRLDWTESAGNPPKTARIINFCGSSFRNETVDTRRAASDVAVVSQLGFHVLEGGIGRIPSDTRVPLAHVLEDVRSAVRGEFETTVKLLREGVPADTPLGEALQLLGLEIQVNDTRGSKLMFFWKTFDNNPALAELRRILNEPREGSRYRMSFVRDHSAPDQRTVAIGQYRSAPTFHPRDTVSNFPARAWVVGYNNLAAIRFQKGSSGGSAGTIAQSGQVAQQIYWTWRTAQDPLGASSPATLMFTRHEVSLTLPSPDEV